MNWDQNWTEVKGKIREELGNLTDSDLEIIAVNKNQLLGNKLQETYELTGEKAENDLTKDIYR